MDGTANLSNLNLMQKKKKGLGYLDELLEKVKFIVGRF